MEKKEATFLRAQDKLTSAQVGVVFWLKHDGCFGTGKWVKQQQSGCLKAHCQCSLEGPLEVLVKSLPAQEMVITVFGNETKTTFIGSKVKLNGLLWKKSQEKVSLGDKLPHSQSSPFSKTQIVSVWKACP